VNGHTRLCENLRSSGQTPEYSSQAATSACDTATCYTILDHLGSTWMLTDSNGSSTVTRYDYLPFGQELLASTNGRTTGMGYLGSPDGSNPKFTSKERDAETGWITLGQGICPALLKQFARAAPRPRAC
jgi:hypothetical protein